MDFQRLDRGLKAGAELLAKADPTLRTQALLAKEDSTALLALYEALCCVDYHKSDPILSTYFDYVFGQVQTRKVLRIGDILPAMARFLFDHNPVRLRFATNAWQKMSATFTAESFDWVVHDVLSDAIWKVSQLSPNPVDVERFWKGFLSMLEHMSEDLISTCFPISKAYIFCEGRKYELFYLSLKTSSRF